MKLLLERYKMGSYTDVVDSNVEIINLDGLKKFLKNIKDGKYKEYKDNEYVDAIKINGKELDFNGIDGWKIISYWYDEFVMFLRDLAPFVDGRVDLQFENNEEAGYFEFNDGICTIHTGNMNWSENSPEEFGVTIKMRPEVRDALIARKL